MMKSKKNFILSVFSIFMCQEIDATDVAKDEIQRKWTSTSSQTSLVNLETVETMQDILFLNEGYKKIQASKMIAPDSDVIKTIEKTNVDYILDLKKILPQIQSEESELKRQELLNAVHQKNNPFETFYY